MYVLPAPRADAPSILRRVPDPDTGGYLADAGKQVIANHTYWWRRVEDGDCLIGAVPKPSKKKEP